MRNLLNREPLVILGIVFTVVLAVIQSLSGQGIISEDLAATLTGLIDNTATDTPLDGWAILLVFAVIGRFLVFSPAKAAELKAEVPEGYVKAE